MPDDRIRRPPPNADRPLQPTVVRPLQRFLGSATAASGVLLVAAAFAIAVANVPFGDAWEKVWRTPVAVGLGTLRIEEPVRFWVNEGLMTFFFLLAGMEIKREVTAGELRDPRAAALPVLAAIGGMALPAALYLAVTSGTAGADGWGAAMPTDLAFALGVLVLAARAAPPGLRTFLLTLAIVDDVGTIVMFALFYASDLSASALGLAAIASIAIVVLERAHVDTALGYAACGAIMWLALYEGGVHPALAGVVLGLLAPAGPIRRPDAAGAQSRRASVVSLERRLLPWVNFGVLPLFALANAGVRFTDVGGWRTGGGLRVLLALGVLRPLAKIAGIAGVGWLATSVGLARLPDRVGIRHLAGAGAAAGIAFTVSLLVVDASFASDPELLAAAKVGVIASWLVSGVCALAILRFPDAGPRSD